MNRFSLALLSVTALLVVACGGEPVSPSALSAHQALASAPEALELASPDQRSLLFREVASSSQLESGRPATPNILFPWVMPNGDVLAAPGFDPRLDLFQATDAGHPLLLTFEGPGERWPQDRRESLQGLSEREAAELIARTLLAQWGIAAQGPVQVDRAYGAPYAAAYVNGVLRLNPSFVYLAAAASAASTAP